MNVLEILVGFGVEVNVQGMDVAECGVHVALQFLIMLKSIKNFGKPVESNIIAATLLTATRIVVGGGGESGIVVLFATV